MSEVFIVTEVGTQYDDEYYEKSYDGDVQIKNVFSNYESALKYKLELEADFIKEFRLSDFYETWNEYADVLKEHGMNHNNTFEDAKNVLRPELFSEIMHNLDMYQIKKIAVKD